MDVRTSDAWLVMIITEKYHICKSIISPQPQSSKVRDQGLKRKKVPTEKFEVGEKEKHFITVI